MKDSEIQLIRDYLDDRISAENLDRLNALLERDAEARARFRAMATMEEGLRDLAVSISDVVPFMRQERDASGDEEAALAGPLPANQPVRWLWAGIAAMFMICLGLAALLWQRSGDGVVPGDSVARLERVSDDAVFSPNHQLPSEEGSLLTKGWMHLERGTVRILFRSGASVELEGATAFGIDSPMRAFLEYGKARVHAPDSARDFVVATEGMEVVDLGTRFEIDVDPDSRESSVTVTEGLVDLHLGSRGTQRRIQPLEAGWQAQVDESGKIMKLEERPEPRPVPNSKPDSPLLAHWRLDELGPAGVMADSGKGQLDGVFRQGSEGGPRPGVNGESLDFGTDGYVDLSEHLPLFTQLDAFTFSAWIRDPGENVGILFSLSDGTVNNRIQFNLNRKFLAYLWQNRSPHWDSVAGKIDGWNPGQWYHVAVSVNPDGVRLYRDGELIGSGSIGVQIGTPFQTLAGVHKPTQAYLGYINQGSAGRGRIGGPQRFGGVMDDVQFYADALDSAAIRFLHDHPGKAWSPGDE